MPNDLKKMRLEIVKSLNSSSRSNSIKWNPTDGENPLFVHFTDTKVIEFVKGINHQLDELYVIRVKNKDGQVLDSFSDEDFGDQNTMAFKLMEDLFTFIQDETSPAKSALEDVLKELRQYNLDNL